MKHLLLNILVLSCFSLSVTTTFGQISEASNQYYAQLRVIEAGNDSVKLSLEVALVPSNEGAKLGSSDFRFVYNSQNLTNPTLDENHLTANYDDVKMGAINTNELVFSASLQNPNTGIELDTFPNFTPLATINFEVINLSTNTFDWTEKINDTRGTTLYFDDEATLRHPVELINSTNAIDQSPSNTSNNSSLPIELLSFDAKKMGKQVSLTWLTANELNNDFFEIQRLNKAGEFEILGSLLSQGNSNSIQEYKWIDETPLAGINYYRLRQVDFDGTESYSSVISIEMMAQGMDLTIFPNPVVDELLVQLPKHNDMNVKIIVHNFLGQVIEIQNSTKGEETIRMNMGAVEKGIYTLTVVGSDWQSTKTFKVL